MGDTSPRVRPATRDGVSPSYVKLPDGPWKTIVEFLQQRFPSVSHQEWLARIDRDEVIDESGEPIASDSIYRAHRIVYYYRHIEAEREIPFAASIVFQNEHMVVADKPHFLPVMPAGRYLHETLLVRLKRSLNIDDLAPAHRIDKDTAGLVLFTKHGEARRRYAALFRNRTVHKCYEAIAGINTALPLPMTYRSRLVESQPFIKMHTVPGESNSETHIELLDLIEDTSRLLARYRLRPITGKKHQLRVQLCTLGIPIVNDQLYPTIQPMIQPTLETKTDYYDQPLQLLARSLTFTDPFTNEQFHFESQRQLLW
jgi:tRNA pseudouridine32 synthase / 23S rRNA pseudouridine746 synthase